MSALGKRRKVLESYSPGETLNPFPPKAYFNDTFTANVG